MIKELRERTGVGLAACKSVLQEANGDMDVAITKLNERGVMAAAKKADRDTNVGMIAFAVDQVIALAEVSAETDFVVKNELFQKFAKTIATEAAKTSPDSLESFLAQPFSENPGQTIEDFRSSMVLTIGENIQIKRLKCLPKASNSSFGVYSHLGGKVVSAVEVSGIDDEAFAKSLAVHSAALAPQFVHQNEVPQDVIESHNTAVKKQAEDQNIPNLEEFIQKKLDSFYDEVVFLRQPFINDGSKTIAQVLEDKSKSTGQDITVSSFIRWTTG